MPYFSEERTAYSFKGELNKIPEMDLGTLFSVPLKETFINYFWLPASRHNLVFDNVKFFQATGEEEGKVKILVTTPCYCKGLGL